MSINFTHPKSILSAPKHETKHKLQQQHKTSAIERLLGCSEHKCQMNQVLQDKVVCSGTEFKVKTEKLEFNKIHANDLAG